MHKSITFITFYILIECCGFSRTDEDINKASELCYATIKPILEHIPVVQKRFELCQSGAENKLDGRLEKIESQLAILNKMEIFLDSQVKQMEQQLADALGKVSSTEAKIKETERQLEHQQRLVETYKANRLKQFQRIGSKYYYIGEMESLSWMNSSTRCQQMGGHLINIESQAEYEMVSEKLTRDNLYWTGTNDRDSEGEFVSELGERASFIEWRSHPDNYNNEDCVELLPYEGVNDNDCHAEFPFICEISGELN